MQYKRRLNPDLAILFWLISKRRGIKQLSPVALTLVSIVMLKGSLTVDLTNLRLMSALDTINLMSVSIRKEVYNKEAFRVLTCLCLREVKLS